MSTRPDPLIIGLAGRAGVGKDTAAAWLFGRHGFERYAFADPLRSMLGQLLADAGVDPGYLYESAAKELVIPELGVSARQLMQTLGTEWGRSLRPDFWLRMAELALGLPDAPVHDRIVISDVRFPDEAAWIKARGGFVLRIERPTAPGVRAHVSEALQFAADATIDNSLTLALLHLQLDEAISDLVGAA